MKFQHHLLFVLPDYQQEIEHLGSALGKAGPLPPPQDRPVNNHAPSILHIQSLVFPWEVVSPLSGHFNGETLM